MSSGIQIPQDMRFQQREWLVQRIAWIVMALIILAALGGLFGYGPASWASDVDSTGKLRIEYERFGRVDAAVELKVWVDPSLFSDDRVEVWIDRGFIDAQQIDSITPEPSRAEPGAERCVFSFPAPRGGDRAYIVFHLAPQISGRYSGRLGTPGGPDLPIAQFVYP